MNITYMDYEKLDTNRKEIYEHYYKCCIVISQITNVLIARLTQELEYLPPLLLEYSYDKDTYKKYRSYLKHIKKQIKSFEKNIVYNNSSKFDDFPLDSQKVLCISNQLRSLVNKSIKLLSNSDNLEITDMINTIFSDSKSLCATIKKYTLKCRKDKNLFNLNDIEIQYIIKKHDLFMENRKDKELPSRYKETDTIRIVTQRYREYLSDDIRQELERLSHMIDRFNPCRGVDISATIHRNNVTEKYNEIMDMIKRFTIQQQKKVLAYIIGAQDEINLAALDCNMLGDNFKKYYDLINQIQLLSELENFNDYNDVYQRYNSAISEYASIISTIIENNQPLDYMKCHSTTVEYLKHDVRLVQNAIDDFDDSYTKYMKFLDSCGIKEQHYNQGEKNDNDDYDDYYDYYDYDYPCKRNRKIK